MKTQEANWVTRSRKAAGAKGPAQADVLEDIAQNLQVADLDRFEYDWCGGTRHPKLTVSVGAIAAQLAQITIFNPAGSGTIALIDQIEVAAGPPAGVFEVAGGFIYADSAFALVGTVPHDSRWFNNVFPPPVTGLTTCIFRGGNAAASAISTRTDRFMVQAVAAGNGLASVFARRIVLAPGVGYALVHSQSNTALQADVYVKERVAASGELP
jgi:hypothetical protein